MNVRRQFLLSLLAASLFPQWGGAQELPTDVRQEIGKFLDTTARKDVSASTQWPWKEIRCNCLPT